MTFFCVVSSDLAILPTLTYTYGDIPSLGAILSTFASPSTRPPKVKVKTLKTNKKQPDVAEVSCSGFYNLKKVAILRNRTVCLF